MSLLQKTKSGVYWTGGAQLLNHILQIVFTAVLARLLSPKEFGLVAMAMVFGRLIKMVQGLGLGGAIIQGKNLDQVILSSVYWLNLISALLFAGLLALIAPIGAWFYGEPLLRDIIYVLSLNMVVAALGGVHQVLLRKSLKFKGLALISIISTTIANTVAIIFAFIGFGVWSLVFRISASVVFSTCAVWAISEWKPDFRFKLYEMKGLLSFGGYMTLRSVFKYFSKNIDFIFIGKVYGAEILGLYTIAYNLAVLPGEQAHAVLIGVLFPSFSAIQDDVQKLKRAYFSVMKILALLLLVFTFGTAVLSDVTIDVIYGEKWGQASGLLSILVFTGFVIGMMHLAGAVILAKGYVKILLYLDVIRAFFLLALFCLLIPLVDIFSVAYIYTVVHLSILLVAWNYANKYIGSTMIETLQTIACPLLIAILIGIGGICLRYVYALLPFAQNKLLLFSSFWIFTILLSFFLFISLFSNVEKQIMYTIITPFAKLG